MGAIGYNAEWLTDRGGVCI